MDDYQTARLNAFSSWVRPDLEGIEIGPGYRPTFSKAAGYRVKVIDHCPTAELVAKYEADQTIPRELVRQIEAVDIVWSSGAFEDLPELQGRADYVAACHVIEHATDIVGFLNGCASLLRDGGTLLLAIPDRRLVLDCCRPASTLGDVLLAFVDPAAYDLKSRMDEAWYGALLDGGGAWSAEHLALAIGEGRLPRAQHGLEFSAQAWSQCVAARANQNLKTPGYRDAHRWAFDPYSFEEIVRFLRHFGHTDLELCECKVGFGCEFYAVLGRHSSPQTDSSAERLSRARDRVLAQRASRSVC